jgi:hypothetical protein
MKANLMMSLCPKEAALGNLRKQFTPQRSFPNNWIVAYSSLYRRSANEKQGDISIVIAILPGSMAMAALTSKSPGLVGVIKELGSDELVLHVTSSIAGTTVLECNKRISLAVLDCNKRTGASSCVAIGVVFFAGLIARLGMARPHRGLFIRLKKDSREVKGRACTFLRLRFSFFGAAKQFRTTTIKRR